jgi:hypothetical protein
MIFMIMAQGCSKSQVTLYQPSAWDGGYSDMKITKDSYTVEFTGNGFSNVNRVQFYFLYRCAEITIREGYDWFFILEDQAPVREKTAGGIIKMGRGEQPSDVKLVFIAREVMENVEERIVRK